MREDKLRAFFERQRVGAHMVVLQHESVGEPQTFATFPADPMPDIETIFNACADLADELEQAVRVAIVVVNEEGEALAKCFHKQMPIEAHSVDALKAADVSMGAIVAQLLRHIEVQQRAVTGSHMSIYSAFERTLTQFQKVTERQATQITQLTEALRERDAVAGEETLEQREEAVSRKQVWDKFGELGPQVAEFMLKAANARLSNGGGGAANVNGTAKVVD
jgi:nitrogen regulatory protein PII-like uncharacterized protein